MEDFGGGGVFYFIRIYFNIEEYWIKAFKFMFVNFKWSLVWVFLRYR